MKLGIARNWYVMAGICVSAVWVPSNGIWQWNKVRSLRDGCEILVQSSIFALSLNWHISLFTAVFLLYWPHHSHWWPYRSHEWLHYSCEWSYDSHWWLYHSCEWLHGSWGWSVDSHLLVSWQPLMAVSQLWMAAWQLWMVSWHPLMAVSQLWMSA